MKLLKRRGGSPSPAPVNDNPAPGEGAFFRMERINKFYRMGEEQAHILKDIDLTLERGEYLSVLGPSGSGKSTLMNIIGCLDVANSGRYVLDGQEIDALGEGELARIRSREIGFIFQNSQLLPRLTAQKNVELPLIYAGVPPRERRRRAREMLERVGLSDRMGHTPNQLSGGQQQRVAIARALVGNPTLLLADEPTGALDQKTGRQVMGLFRELNDEGRTIIMITHDMNIAKYARRVVHIIDGVLTEGGGTADA
ncbi:MAG: ABC transporter ATP-binding protein [Clostridia bacterium]|nr:ABC transporter ATP-binding protein [Clostridia bacterium]